jgi:hypothetical protein
VLDANPSDPGWTHALTEAGIAVAAASTSGAREIADGITTYDPWSFFSILRAVAAAQGRGAGRIRRTSPEISEIARALALLRDAPAETTPLVSFVIPSFNRPRQLEQTLKNLLKQHYPNFEIVVVNDGGTRLLHLAELDPRIRVFDRIENVGAHKAMNFGLLQAAGEYVQPCTDDDVIYPDHGARMVRALEHTGATVAHGNTLVCVQGVDSAGNDTTTLITDRFIDAVDLAETYAYHRVCFFMIRRSAILELGGYDEELFMADIDLLIRMAERYDFVQVPVVTAEHWMRGSSDQMSLNPKIDHRVELLKLFERHPAPERPYVAALRERVLAMLGDAQKSSSTVVIGDSSSSSSSPNSSSSSSSV